MGIKLPAPLDEHEWALQLTMVTRPALGGGENMTVTLALCQYNRQRDDLTSVYAENWDGFVIRTNGWTTTGERGISERWVPAMSRFPGEIAFRVSGEFIQRAKAEAVGRTLSRVERALEALEEKQGLDAPTTFGALVRRVMSVTGVRTVVERHYPYGSMWKSGEAYRRHYGREIQDYLDMRIGEWLREEDMSSRNIIHARD